MLWSVLRCWQLACEKINGNEKVDKRGNFNTNHFENSPGQLLMSLKRQIYDRNHNGADKKAKKLKNLDKIESLGKTFPEIYVQKM